MQDVIDTNLTSVFNFCQAATMQMMSQRYGRIINMSSVRLMCPIRGRPTTRQQRWRRRITTLRGDRAARRGVTANAVAPGFIETDMTVAVVNLAGDEIKEEDPCKAAGRPEDISNAVLFFAADESSYVTGRSLKSTED